MLDFQGISVHYGHQADNITVVGTTLYDGYDYCREHLHKNGRPTVK